MWYVFDIIDVGLSRSLYFSLFHTHTHNTLVCLAFALNTCDTLTYPHLITQVLKEDMRELRDVWESTSFALELEQTNPKCVEQEKLSMSKRTGPQYQLAVPSFILYSNISLRTSLSMSNTGDKLKHMFKSLGKYPQRSQAITYDARAVYNNSDANHGLHVIEYWLKLLEKDHNIDRNFPIKLFLEGLE